MFLGIHIGNYDEQQDRHTPGMEESFCHCSGGEVGGKEGRNVEAVKVGMSCCCWWNKLVNLRRSAEAGPWR